ncbi:MAG: hypothetical protein IKF90_24550 [Parasporobacterium sp.]|nr:hypothetical protein [Parasporobacterium sp.]
MTVLLSGLSSFTVSVSGIDPSSGAAGSDSWTGAELSVSDDSASCAGRSASASLSAALPASSVSAVSASVESVSDDSAVSVSTASVSPVVSS